MTDEPCEMIKDSNSEQSSSQEPIDQARAQQEKLMRVPQTEPDTVADHRDHQQGDSVLSQEHIRLLAFAVVNCHVLARRALHRSTSAYDREKWEHVLRICEQAGARSQGVLRASLPTELTDGSILPAAPEAK